MRSLIKKSLFIFSFSVIFMLAGDDWDRVYLSTYPRSGNHWIRYLIEEATGVVTTSVYCDGDHPFHDPEKLPCGGYAPINGYEGTRRYPEKGDVVVTKTHYPCVWKQENDLLQYKKTIRIVRHPVDSFYSYFIRTGQQQEPGQKIPETLLLRFMIMWDEFQTFWNEQPNVITIRYEDLLQFPEMFLESILIESGIDFDIEDVLRAVKRYPPEGGALKHISRYDREQLEFIERYLLHHMESFGYTKDSILY